MSSKQVDVTCPCCSSKLVIDVLTGKVMRAERTEQAASGKDAWGSAQERVRGRTSGGMEKLEKALEGERGKADRLDDLFRKASEKLRKDEDD